MAVSQFSQDEIILYVCDAVPASHTHKKTRHVKGKVVKNKKPMDVFLRRSIHPRAVCDGLWAEPIHHHHTHVEHTCINNIYDRFYTEYNPGIQTFASSSSSCVVF
jgi:hypothetical protein